jgi:hypothetical protein
VYFSLFILSAESLVNHKTGQQKYKSFDETGCNSKPLIFFLLKIIRECLECTYIESINYFHAIKHGSDNESGVRAYQLSCVSVSNMKIHITSDTDYIFPFLRTWLSICSLARNAYYEKKKTHMWYWCQSAVRVRYENCKLPCELARWTRTCSRYHSSEMLCMLNRVNATFQMIRWCAIPPPLRHERSRHRANHSNPSSETTISHKCSLIANQ